MTTDRRLLSCALLLALFLSHQCFSLDAQQEEMNVSMEIQSLIKNFEKEYLNMEGMLMSLTHDLNKSETERKILESQSLGLLNSLANTTEQLETSLKVIRSYELALNEKTKSLREKEILINAHETDLKFREKLCFMGLIIICVRMFMVAIGAILFFLNIRIPKWLDLIL